MGTPFGRQNFEEWDKVRKFDDRTAQKLKYIISSSIRHRFPHANCSHDNICNQCVSLIHQIVTKTREEHEEYLGNRLSELINIKCPFPHNGD